MEIDDRRWGGSSYGEDPRGYPQFGYGDRYERFGFRSPYERFGFGYPYEHFGFDEPYGRFGIGYRSARFGYEGFDEMNRGEHIWRGGVLAWLGAGIRAGAGWFGNRLQQWGSWFGGRVSGGSAEIGRAVRGRGEQVASALEDQDERAASTLGFRRNRPPRYRRPDERILDDVWHRISLAAVDPQDVEVEVNGGVVTLSGRVSTRYEKRVLEDIADNVFGVQEVHNHLRLARSANEARTGAETQPLQTNAGAASSQRSFGENAAQAERH
jgi:HSP20 family molecular chaperone IbpA